MFLTPTLPLCLLILVSSAQAEGIISRSFQNARHAAARRTHLLARDLRAAFGNVLVSQNPLDSTRNHAVYCKAGFPNDKGPGSVGGTGENGTEAGGSSSESGTQSATATSAGASATGSAVSTPWKLVKEHVRFPLLSSYWLCLTPVILKSGESFFQDWDFWTFPDPTHGELPSIVFHLATIVFHLATKLIFSSGIVDYISESEAVSSIHHGDHSFHSHTVIYVLLSSAPPDYSP